MTVVVHKLARLKIVRVLAVVIVRYRDFADDLRLLKAGVTKDTKIYDVAAEMVTGATEVFGHALVAERPAVVIAALTRSRHIIAHTVVTAVGTAAERLALWAVAVLLADVAR